MPGGVRPPTGDVEAMIAWLYRHGAPRTGEVLRRLERHAWAIELPAPDAETQDALWARAEFPGVEAAVAAVAEVAARIDPTLRWTPAARPGEVAHVAVEVTQA
jgi:anti-sigma-K factor RskA